MVFHPNLYHPKHSAKTLPFDVPAPSSPFSYQGQLFSVDHYLQANLDFAGAMDDVVTKRYVVLPGPLVGPPHSRLMAVTRRAVGRRLPAWRAILGALATFIGLASLPIGLVLVFLGLFLLVPPLRRSVAESRLGKVAANLGTRIATPGDALPVRLQIKAKGRASINKASVEIRAREVCVYRSGDERKVHRHLAFSREIPITPATFLDPGSVRTFTASVPIPDFAGHTFVSEDNRLTWEAVVRVDIPAWPDWEKVYPIVIWPTPGHIGRAEAGALLPEGAEPRVAEAGAGALGSRFERPPDPVAEREIRNTGTEDRGGRPAARKAPPPPVVKELAELDAMFENLLGRRQLEAPWPGPEGEVTPVHVQTEPEPRISGSDEPPPPGPIPDDLPGLGQGPPQGTQEGPVAEPAQDPSPLLREAGVPGRAQDPPPLPREAGPLQPDLSAKVLAILAERVIGGARDELIREMKGSTFRFDLTVSRVERTFAMYTDLAFRNGRTVTGTVGDSEVAVCVWYPEERNEEVDGFEKGGSYPVVGTVAEWDPLRSRPNLKAVAS